MPKIRLHTELVNNYDDISAQCHDSREPLFITKDNEIDLVVMSVEAYEQLASRAELLGKVSEGLHDVRCENTKPFSDAIAEVRANRR